MANNTQVASATFSLANIGIHTKDGLYSLNDLHKAAGGEDKHKPAYFLRNDQTRSLITEISNKNNQSANLHLATKTVRGGDNPGTYACKQVVCAYAMWISPAFYLKVIDTFLALHDPEESSTLTKEQWGYIYQHVLEQCKGKGKFFYRSIFGTLKRHFGVAKCEHIKQSDFAKACELLEIPVPDFTPPVLVETKPPHIVSMDFDTRQSGYYHITIAGGKAYRQHIMYGSDAGDPFSPVNQRPAA